VQRCTASAATNPYRIPRGQFGATEELLISPEHHVLVNGRLVKASHLGLQQKVMKNEIIYYNLELEAWANMTVAGVTVESLAPMRRLTITMAEFKKLVGPVTPELQKKINRACRFLNDGHVDVPVITTKNIRTHSD